MERQTIKNTEQTWNDFHLVIGVCKLSQYPLNCFLVRHNSVLKGEFLKSCSLPYNFFGGLVVYFIMLGAPETRLRWDV
jgi:hypothetical protein